MDVKAVGSDLTPAQQDETMSDLAFFLDQFGSTRAVRSKLQGQEQDIKRLETRVRRLLNEEHEEEEKDGKEEENATIETQNSAEGVDQIMEDLDFFLRTYGSTRAVRDTLESQSQKIVGLRRTVQWLQERKLKIPKVKNVRTEESGSEQNGEDGVDENDVDHCRENTGDGLNDGAQPHAGDSLVLPQHGAVKERESDCNTDVEGHVSRNEVNVGAAGKQDVVMESPERAEEQNEGHNIRDAPIVSKTFEAVAAYYKALHAASEVYKSKVPRGSSAIDYTTSSKQTRPQKIASEDSSKTNEPKGNADNRNMPADKLVPEQPVSHKRKNICQIPDCNKISQAYGVCWSHGGFCICKFPSCGRKTHVTSSGLCRLHSRSKCMTTACTKMAASSGQGYCSRHVRELRTILPIQCVVNGCHRARVEQNYCLDHRLKGDDRKVKTLTLNDKAPTQALPTKHKNKATDPHQRDPSETGSSKPASTCRRHHTTCKFFGCMKWVRAEEWNGGSGEYCALHRGPFESRTVSTKVLEPGTVASVVQAKSAPAISAIVPRNFRDESANHYLCNEPGCGNKSITYGMKKGYCFRHGGGTPCSVDGCTKAPQRKGLCAAHGGYYQCKVEGCAKRVVVRGRCKAHHLQHEMCTTVTATLTR